ncbi:sensor histidine kinase [Fodinibius sp. AD559]|uniref:sensor histidine kinase n=1 Tax=Fodinibius sp. AD559 TaxID=3424179 RepID=UPI0040470237
MQSLQSEIQQRLSQSIQKLESKENLSLKQQQEILGELKETKNYFQTLSKWVDSAQKISDFGSWEHYHQKDELIWSEETYHILGFEPYSVTPSYELFIDCIHPKDREQIEEAYKESIKNEEPYHEVYRVQIDDTIKYIEAHAEHFYDESGSPELSIGTNQNVTERELEKKQLSESLDSQHTLLQEIHHRVKNNLAVVAGMLQLEWLQHDDPAMINTLQDSINRIKTIAGIHQQLYKSDRFEDVALGENIKNLATELISSMKTDTEIQLESDCDTVYLDVSQTLPCSLIANEVVTNAIKHAFEGRKTGLITLQVKDNSGNIKLRISDNGVGLPDDFEDRKGSLGMNLIDTLSSQLDGEYTFNSTDQGTEFNLVFSSN